MISYQNSILKSPFTVGGKTFPIPCSEESTDQACQEQRYPPAETQDPLGSRKMPRGSGDKPNSRSWLASSVLVLPSCFPSPSAFPCPGRRCWFLSVFPQLFPPLVGWKKPGRCLDLPVLLSHPCSAEVGLGALVQQSSL